MNEVSEQAGEKKILELEDVHTYYGSIQAPETSLAMSRSCRPAWPDGRLKRPVDMLRVIW
jgi:hypothetical protein